MRAIVHSSHFFSIAGALWRVFLLPLALSSTQLPPRSPSVHRLPKIRYRNAYSLAALQSQKGVKKPQDSGPPRDEGIAAREVQVVDSDSGTLQPPRSLRDALRSIDRNVNFLIKVGEKVHPRYTNLPGPEQGQPDVRPQIPICKTISKAQFRQGQAEKLKPKKDASAQIKEVEVNPAMSAHDFGHRLKRLKEFLDDGRRVEVVFGKRKKRGWMQKRDVAEDEVNEMLRQIRQAAGEVQGAKEWKAMEGEVGAVLTMHFEAKRDRPEAKKKYEGDYKVKKKFQAEHEQRTG
ncbi:MAG: hypothetical protein LQ346_001285 [Caloplaca aetnensis]|nr:MAG: hypothetical protein LQ346_001285 [Caloplaca aetnensis]